MIQQRAPSGTESIRTRVSTLIDQAERDHRERYRRPRTGTSVPLRVDGADLGRAKTAVDRVSRDLTERAHVQMATALGVALQDPADLLRGRDRPLPIRFDGADVAFVVFALEYVADHSYQGDDRDPSQYREQARRWFDRLRGAAPDVADALEPTVARDEEFAFSGTDPRDWPNVPTGR